MLVGAWIPGLFSLSFRFPHPLLFQTCDSALYWQSNHRSSGIKLGVSAPLSSFFFFFFKEAQAFGDIYH